MLYVPILFKKCDKHCNWFERYIFYIKKYVVDNLLTDNNLSLYFEDV